MSTATTTRVVVLGAGRVGRAMAVDLAEDPTFQVTAVDVSRKQLARFPRDANVATIQSDLRQPEEVRARVARADLVVGAVPGSMGFDTLEAVIEAAKPIVDISFFEEDPFQLDALARERGVVALIDCGVAPGLSNMLLGHAESTFDEVTQFRCYVGGLPVERVPPWEYKAPSSPNDVIEGYVRPARMRRGGEPVTLPALSEPELIEFPEIGTLEAFNSDGLRTLLATAGAADLSMKTLRYPGHVERIAALRDAGLLSSDPIGVNGVSMVPRALTSALLFDQWELNEDDRDLTMMRVEIDASTDGASVRSVYNMLDRYDEQSRVASMSRATGYTCTAVARLVAAGLYRQPGISPPEYIGREPACFGAVLGDLADRRVNLEHTQEGP